MLRKSMVETPSGLIVFRDWASLILWMVKSISNKF